MSDLRRRRHAETKAAIVDAALTLFATHGFGETAMEQIAEHAGVSRSTLYRRFSSKEEIVLEIPLGWLAAWDEAINALDDDTPLIDALTVGSLAVAANIDASADQVLQAYAALRESPTLQSSGAATTRWLERIAALIIDKSDASPIDAATIAGAFMGAIDTMMWTWADSGGEGSVVDATQRVADLLSPIVPS